MECVLIRHSLFVQINHSDELSIVNCTHSLCSVSIAANAVCEKFEITLFIIYIDEFSGFLVSE